MKSLNEIYNNNELFYYCNTCGEINIPNTHPLSYHDSDELPLRERNLYENYWYEGAGCCMYVVNYNGNAAMALGFLFDEGYLCDILHKDEVDNADMEVFYDAISDYAKMLENNEMLSYCDVVVGKNTDPDGHEIVVIVPYERRSKIKDIAEMLDKTVYSSVEALI